MSLWPGFDLTIEHFGYGEDKTSPCLDASASCCTCTSSLKLQISDMRERDRERSLTRS